MMSEHHHRQHQNNEPLAQISGDSIYNLDTTWKNQNNLKIKLVQFKGSILALAMVYTSCAHVCPLIVSDMKKIQKALPYALGNKMKFVLVSIDPKRDTPAQLMSFAKKRHLEKANWTLLTGSDDSALELAAVLGVKYKKTTDGEFSHSNLISIIDKQGVVRYRQVGLNQKPNNSIDVIKKL